MTIVPRADTVWLIALAVGCTSPQQALLRIGVTAVIGLLTRLFHSVLSRLSLPLSLPAACLFSLGVGAALAPIAQVTFPALQPLELADPITALLFAVCGPVALQENRPHGRLFPSFIVIGVLRELLSGGTLWGITVLPLGISPTLEDGAGGLLIAAVMLWMFCLNSPLLGEHSSRHLPLIIPLLAAVGSTLGIVTRILPDRYSVWGITALGVLILSLLPARYDPREWIVLLPVYTLLTRRAALWWPPVLIALGAFVGLSLLTGWHHKLRLTSLAKRFHGAPATLAVASVLSCIFSSLPL